MAPNEVRIGNWVLIPTNNEIKIPCFPKKIKAITLFGEFDFTEPTYSESHLIPAKHCMGVELTEEWLSKIGLMLFNEGPYFYYRNFKFYEDEEVTFRVNPENMNVYFGIHLIFKQMKYVHELQNIFYALTGSELS